MLDIKVRSSLLLAIGRLFTLPGIVSQLILVVDATTTNHNRQELVLLIVQVLVVIQQVVVVKVVVLIRQFAMRRIGDNLSFVVDVMPRQLQGWLSAGQ